MNSKIKILIEQSAPSQISPYYKKPTLHERVCKLIKKVNNNQLDLPSDWRYLKRLYEILSKRPSLTAEQADILYELEEVMQKFGGHDHEDSVGMDAQFMHRGKEMED